MTIPERIEAVRAFFELADNWPTVPFRITAGWVFDPAQFLDAHLEMVLSGKNTALVLPYLERLEGLAIAVEMGKIPCAALNEVKQK